MNLGRRWTGNLLWQTVMKIIFIKLICLPQATVGSLQLLKTFKTKISTKKNRVNKGRNNGGKETKNKKEEKKKKRALLSLPKIWTNCLCWKGFYLFIFIPPFLFLKITQSELEYI